MLDMLDHETWVKWKIVTAKWIVRQIFEDNNQQGLKWRTVGSVRLLIKTIVYTEPWTQWNVHTTAYIDKQQTRHK